jgi:hypothetical protein
MAASYPGPAAGTLATGAPAAYTPAPSTMATAAPAAYTPRPASHGADAPPVVVAPRKRWPLIIAGVILVAATVSITLAVGRRDRSSAVAPTPGSSVAIAPASDAAVLVVTPPHPVTGGDPWSTPDAGVAPDARVARDPEPEKDDADEPYTGLPADFDKQVDQAREQAKKSCKTVVTNAQLAAMPMAQPQIVMCFCALGDKANALKALARITDENMRKGALQLCAYYGMPLH